MINFFSNLSFKHYAVLAALFTSLGSMVSSLPNWPMALQPSFVGGLLGVVASMFVALNTEKVQQ